MGACFVGTGVRAQTALVDWEDGQWNHGAGYATGWRAPAAPTNSYSGTTTNGGISITATYSLFGTADGQHSGVPVNPPAAPLNGTNEPSLDTFNAPFTRDAALVIGTSRDNNSGTLSNYVRFSLEFGAYVRLNSSAPLLIGDVDDGSAWEDFVAIQASSNGIPVALFFTSNSYFHVATNYLGLSGFRGQLNRDDLWGNNNPTGALITVSSPGYFDRLDLYYFQGPGQASGFRDHAIWIEDVQVEVIPEPATVAALLGAAVLIAARRRQ